MANPNIPGKGKQADGRVSALAAVGARSCRIECVAYQRFAPRTAAKESAASDGPLHYSGVNNWHSVASEPGGGSPRGQSQYFTEPRPVRPWRPGGPLRRLANLFKNMGATRIPKQATEAKSHIIALTPYPWLPACQASPSAQKRPIAATT